MSNPMYKPISSSKKSEQEGTLERSPPYDKYIVFSAHLSDNYKQNNFKKSTKDLIDYKIDSDLCPPVWTVGQFCDDAVTSHLCLLVTNSQTSVLHSVNETRRDTQMSGTLSRCHVVTLSCCHHIIPLGNTLF